MSRATSEAGCILGVEPDREPTNAFMLRALFLMEGLHAAIDIRARPGYRPSANVEAPGGAISIPA